MIPSSWPRGNRLDAVLAAGELRLQAEEEHHLREGQRDHREIDTLAADREIADHGAERGRGRDAGQDAQFGRQPPHFDGMGGDVGGAAKKTRHGRTTAARHNRAAG